MNFTLFTGFFVFSYCSCWCWNFNTLATWCRELTPWKRPWCWERLKAGGEGDNRGWDGWMASPTLWTWVWVSSGNWWWTGKPGVLQSMGSQRVGHDWTTQLNWICRLFARKNNFSTICLIYAAQRTWELSEKFLLEKKGIIDNLSVC